MIGYKTCDPWYPNVLANAMIYTLPKFNMELKHVHSPIPGCHFHPFPCQILGGFVKISGH